MSVYNIWVTKHREYENAAIVYEIDNDGDLHAFSVMTNEHGEVREMLVCPQTIEDMQQCIRSLNEGDCPIGWENGTDLNEEDMTYVVKVTKSWEEAE